MPYQVRRRRYQVHTLVREPLRFVAKRAKANPLRDLVRDLLPRVVRDLLPHVVRDLFPHETKKNSVDSMLQYLQAVPDVGESFELRSAPGSRPASAARRTL
eukprot:gnl/TRDRNA2_/TRDRNA2_167483_c0_seq1.p4 gnl/TRDRNA2_/TRDRNA2_167483_c0~~gnl/TRDRNA2_/TRDRNA2_167483_c0_seq1.p4  ORF type:complete len:101 (+),score=6.14 gnl/TRDRNA2_/TRDRNA2_167483_c0_seq1:530-832(+)